MFDSILQIIILTEILGLLAWCTHIGRKPVSVALSPRTDTIWADQPTELTASRVDVATTTSAGPIRVWFSIPDEMKAFFR